MLNLNHTIYSIPRAMLGSYLLPGRSCDKRLGTPRSIPLIYSFLLLLLLRLILMHGIVASKIYLYIDALHTVCKLSKPIRAV